MRGTCAAIRTERRNLRRHPLTPSLSRRERGTVVALRESPPRTGECRAKSALDLAGGRFAGVLPERESGETAAAASKPVLTVSFAGYNALRAQLEAIGKLAGNPRLPDQYEALLVLLTKGRGLAGLDSARPWGLVAMSDGGSRRPASSAGWPSSPQRTCVNWPPSSAIQGPANRWRRATTAWSLCEVAEHFRREIVRRAEGPVGLHRPVPRSLGQRPRRSLAALGRPREAVPAGRPPLGQEHSPGDAPVGHGHAGLGNAGRPGAAGRRGRRSIRRPQSGDAETLPGRRRLPQRFGRSAPRAQRGRRPRHGLSRLPRDGDARVKDGGEVVGQGPPL